MSTAVVPRSRLSRSDAILCLLDAVTSPDSSPVQRLLLEGIVCMAQQPSYAEKECRVLRAFDSEEWLLDFHESLAYLQQMGRIRRVHGKYELASEGKEHLATINHEAGLDLDQEASEINCIADKVRTGFGL